MSTSWTRCLERSNIPFRHYLVALQPNPVLFFLFLYIYSLLCLLVTGIRAWCFGMRSLASIS